MRHSSDEVRRSCSCALKMSRTPKQSLRRHSLRSGVLLSGVAAESGERRRVGHQPLIAAIHRSDRWPRSSPSHLGVLQRRSQRVRRRPPLCLRILVRRLWPLHQELRSRQRLRQARIGQRHSTLSNTPSRLWRKPTSQTMRARLRRRSRQLPQQLELLPRPRDSRRDGRIGACFCLVSVISA